MSESFEKLMEEHGKEFDAEEAGDYGMEVPPGVYAFLIVKAELGQAKSSKRWQVAWDIAVIYDPKGKWMNRHVFFYDGITKVPEGTNKHEHNENGVRFFKKRFADLGMTPPKIAQLEKALPYMVGKVVAADIQRKEEGGFTNVYFKAMLANSIDEWKAPAQGTQLAIMISEFQKGVAGKTAGAPNLPVTKTQVSDAGTPPAPTEKLPF